MNTTKTLHRKLTTVTRWRQLLSVMVVARLAVMTALPSPTTLVEASPVSADPAVTVATAADEWLGSQSSAYALSVAPSRVELEEERQRVAAAEAAAQAAAAEVARQEAARVASQRATITRDRAAVPAAPAAPALGLETVSALIDQYSAQYAVSADLMHRIVKCESGYNQYAKNRSSTAAGYAQFLTSTWKSAMRQLGYDTSITQFDGEKNIEALAFYLSTQGTRPWNASKSCWSR